MKTASFDYILKIVQQTNILPITSSCDMGCIFCSHKNNPENIDVYRLPELSKGDIINISEFLDGNSKIIIGESASRIIEGEPFLRKDIIDILKILRKRYPSTVIEITTNGVLLTSEIVNELKKIEPLQINVSLNSSTTEGRKLLFRAQHTESALRGIIHLSEQKIRFHGSIVAMPQIVGYKDIESTAAFLCENGAQTVRIFVPGFSAQAPFSVDFFSTRSRLHEISDSLYKVYGIPVLIEPPEINDLVPEICGIIKNSPAFESGILKGDIIQKIDDYTPLTRVDAYNALYKKSNPGVELERGGKSLSVIIKKGKNESSGAVFYYDIHPDTIHSIQKSINRSRSKKPLVVTSKLAYPVINMGLHKIIGGVDVCIVLSRWFGGSIMCSGLLTVSDIIDSLSGHINLHDAPDLIILPPSPFDISGKDIAGCFYHEIEDTLGIKTIIC